MTTRTPAVDPPIEPPDAPGPPAANIAVLRGQVASEPIRRDLPSGGTVVQFDVATHVVDGARTSTISSPVAWPDPSDAAARLLDVGGEVLVVGSVRRRFFRVGGATQSRTEVVAERVVPTRRRKQVEATLADVVSRLRGG